VPPKTGSSAANEVSSRASTTQVDNIINDVVLATSDSIDDVAVLATVMDSIKAAQHAIDAIALRLTTQSTSIDTVTTNLSTLEDEVQQVRHKVNDLPATISNLSDTVLAITQNLTKIQESSLSKQDIETLIVQKWEDELDPHIKSHYDFKTEASTRLDYLDNTLQNTISTLKNYSQLAGNPPTRPSSSRSTGFHQATSKDFSVFKLQKELKEIKLFGDSLKDLEIFWDAILGAFTNLCQINQAFPYYRDLDKHFTFESHLVDPIKPPRFLPIDTDQVRRNYRSFGDAL
jgi:hypothetical protein